MTNQKKFVVSAAPLTALLRRHYLNYERHEFL